MQNYFTGLIFLLLSQTLAATDAQHRSANDGQLLMQDIPPFPSSLAAELSRYQNIRSARFSGWSEDGNSIYIKTRFGPVNQLHRVDMPAGARTQLTFADEPVAEVAAQPRGGLLAFTSDQGGDEFDQLYLLNPENGLSRQLSDGRFLNNRIIWDRQGQRLAFRSTRRNGRSNDIWIQGVGPSDQATLIHKSNDGSLWKPVDFSRDGQYLLIQQFISVVDSQIWLKRLPDGELQHLVGDPEKPASNIAVGFDRNGENVLFVTNQRESAAEVASVSLKPEHTIRFVPSISDWDITQLALSHDRKRGAFTTNENSVSRLYLFDTSKMTYKLVTTIPLGLISGLVFSPNGRKLGMTLNSANSPNDAYVLELGRNPLSAKRLTRWTYSEVGGLDTAKFSKPIPVSYSSPLDDQGSLISIPAFVYLPPGEGPHPVVIYIHGGPGKPVPHWL
jgi:dipeptidyl aminopeptidase/acylaminoacyl peptidase